MPWLESGGLDSGIELKDERLHPFASARYPPWSWSLGLCGSGFGKPAYRERGCNNG